MLIQEMTTEECFAALAAAGFGRLACARDNQPYVVPVYFAFDGSHVYGFEVPHVYSFSALGQKIEWMRDNPLVCLEIDDVKGYNDWTSVVVFGKYEELPDTPNYQHAREHAHELMQKRGSWWQPACVAVAHHAGPQAFRARLLPRQRRAADRAPPLPKDLVGIAPVWSAVITYGAAAGQAVDLNAVNHHVFMLP